MSEEDAQVEERDIRTLRDVWMSKGFNSKQLQKRTKLSRATLYKMNRKEQDVNFSSVQAVCEALGMSLDDYAKLDACPHSDEYRPRREKQ